MHGSEEIAFRTFSLVTRETTPFMLQWCNTQENGHLPEKVKLFHLQLGRSKKDKHLCCLGSFAKAGGGISGGREQAVGLGTGLWLADCPSASQKSFSSPSGRSTTLMGEGWRLFTLSEMQQGRRPPWLHGKIR